MADVIKEFFVVGMTHVDLAWLRGREEMNEMLEVVVVRLLDALERYPNFKYLLEQVSLFQDLERRRPDLIAKLKTYIQARRIEFVGGMASTLDTNIPNGECYIRNQLIGLKWLRDTWGADVTTGWLVDAFGINAQVPQLLRSFGMTRLMASRMGGRHTHDLFTAKGLDGSTVTVAGWASLAAYTSPENVSWQFCKNWDDIDHCFANADKLTGPGPYLLLPYTENEMLVSLRPLTLVDKRNERKSGEHWQIATPTDYFTALEKAERALPIVDADLNPEFTGCFSLRPHIRIENRRVENLLLEAEKWAALGRKTDKTLRNAVWGMLSYVQFHDVLTGSHPTFIYEDTMQALGFGETTAGMEFKKSAARLLPVVSDEEDHDGYKSLYIFNGLPYERTDYVKFMVPYRLETVTKCTTADGKSYPFEVRDNELRALVTVPAGGYTSLHLKSRKKPKPKPVWKSTNTAVLENEWIRLGLDTVSGGMKLFWKPTGAVLIDSLGDWLVAQQDDGSFQIENPSGAEVDISTGTMELETCDSALGQAAWRSGTFPALAWAGPENSLEWGVEFLLPTHCPEVRLRLTLDWKGDGTRIRLALPTTINATSLFCEIPFGIVERKPYTSRNNAKGEWAVHRFAAIEDSAHGIALVNTGVVGVELSGGTLYTTLLRAPRAAYAGMLPDDTSSQHGSHTFDFSILPYAGSWKDTGVVRYAQERNTPLIETWHLGSNFDGVSASYYQPPENTVVSSASYFRLEPDNVVLSTIKQPEDGSEELIVRVYETVGRETEAVFAMPEMTAAQPSDLKESPGVTIPTPSGELRFAIKPFEIRTFRLERA